MARRRKFVPPVEAVDDGWRITLDTEERVRLEAEAAHDAADCGVFATGVSREGGIADAAIDLRGGGGSDDRGGGKTGRNGENTFHVTSPINAALRGAWDCSPVWGG